MQYRRYQVSLTQNVLISWYLASMSNIHYGGRNIIAQNFSKNWNFIRSFREHKFSLEWRKNDKLILSAFGQEPGHIAPAMQGTNLTIFNIYYRIIIWNVYILLYCKVWDFKIYNYTRKLTYEWKSRRYCKNGYENSYFLANLTELLAWGG